MEQLPNINVRPLRDALILIVEDEPVNSAVLQALLSELYHTDTVFSGEEALEYCKTKEPDLILLDLMMPGIGGLETCKAIKANSDIAHIPVIFITSRSSDEDQNQCWEAGCVDFVSKPINGATLRNRVHSHLRLKMQTDALWRMSYLDGLTGAYNRHLLDDALPKLFRSSKRNDTAFALLMIDVDRFKLYNDTYGHLSGDDCLKKICNTINSVLHRPTDVLLRYGGEEFLCLLPDTDSVGAQLVAQHVLEGVRDAKIPHTGSEFDIVTVSIGLTSVPANTEESQTVWLERADSALYQAKCDGRNRIVQAS